MAKEPDREGFYWVKSIDWDEWEVAHWDVEERLFVFCCASELAYYGIHQIEVVGPRIEPPDSELEPEGEPDGREIRQGD